MVLRGKPVAQDIYTQLKKDIQTLRRQNITPSLGVVLVGEDPASLSYIKIKEKISEHLGINFELFHLPTIVMEKKVIELIDNLNQNKYIHGIVVQLPLPQNLKPHKILRRIDARKDVDGFFGNFPAPTPQAVLEILKFYKISFKNKKIVIVGHGLLVGSPLEKILLQEGHKPIICDSKTSNLKDIILTADIVIAGVGLPSLIKPEMVNNHTVIIDAGTSEAKGKIAGDVDMVAYKVVKAYSPVPGGVGPVTVACLMRNVVEAAKK